MTVYELLARLDGVKGQSPSWTAKCPAHEDRTPSLSITEGTDGRALIHDHAGCSAAAVLGALGLTERDLFNDNGNGHGTRSNRREQVAVYDYRDEDDNLLYQVVRYFPKDFRQRRPDGNGTWMWKLGTMRRVLYRLPELLQRGEDAAVWVVEGEKDADTLARHGLAATTNAGGAGKWRREYSPTLKDADVIIVPDTDAPGLAHGEKVARQLHGTAARIRVVTLPRAKDVTEFLSTGGSVDDLTTLAEAAPDWTPAAPATAVSAPDATTGARPSIRIRPELTGMTDDAIDAIVRRPDLGIYVRGRMLVTVARDGSRRDRWLRRPPGAPVIVPIETPRMLGLLDEAVQWMKWSERAKSNVPAMPPDRVAAQVLGRLEWPLPYLDAVIETPTLRPDGSVLASPGWDEATGLLYEPMPGTTWPDVPDHLTRAQVHEAANALLDPVQDFPFVAPSDRAAYLAAVLTLVARHMIDGPVPLFAIRAPTPGTGKTLLGDVIGLAGTGRVPPAMTMTYEPEEIRKRITSLAVAGTAVVLLDNLSGSLGSDVLAAALTKREWEDRLLGVNRMARVPLTTVWLATGNNLGFRRTMARRVVPIDMDAKLEQPEDRTNFRHADLLAHVRRTRPQLVTAALTVLRGFHVARRPAHGRARMGSFEAWDDLIRSAVVWAGLEDPAGANDPAAGRGRVRSQADDDTETLATLLTALDGAFEGGKPFTSADAMKQAETDEALRRDLELAAPAKTGKVTVQSLGYALRAATDRPCGDFVLRARQGKRPRAYQVLRCA